MKKSILLLFVFGIFLSSTVYAEKNIFVSATTGQDIYDGRTWQTAFKTLDHALSLVNASDTYHIYLAEGNYSYTNSYIPQDNTSFFLRGGFPVPTSSTPPTDVCYSEPTKYLSVITQNTKATPMFFIESKVDVTINIEGVNLEKLEGQSGAAGDFAKKKTAFLDARWTTNLDVTIDKVVFKEYISGLGGAVKFHATTDTKVKIKDSFIQGNKSSLTGGGFLYVPMGDKLGGTTKNIDIVIERCTFTGNRTQGTKVGANTILGIVVLADYDHGESTLVLTDNKFCENNHKLVAGDAPGILYANDLGTITAKRNFFTLNQGGESSVFELRSCGKFISEGNVYHENTTVNNGAIYIHNSNPDAGNPKFPMEYYFTNDIFKGNRSEGDTDGGALTVEVKEGTAYVKNCLFLDNVCEKNEGPVALHNSGGAICMTQADLYISSDPNLNGGRFPNETIFCKNTAKYWGGAIFLESGSNITINGATFRGNLAKVDVNNGGGGGAIYGSAGSMMTIMNTKFYNNIAKETGGNGRGGAIYKGGDKNIYVESSEFFGNRATNYGGAIYLDKNSTMIIENKSIFKNNEAQGWGGALYLENGSNVTISNAVLEGNEAIDNSAGAIYIGKNVVVNVDKVYFKENKAKDEGGAIYTRGNLTDNNSYYEENTAGNKGGAMLVYSGRWDVNVKITSSTFYKNSTSNTGSKGGAIYLLQERSNGNVSIDGTSAKSTQFIENFSHVGGAICIESGGAGWLFGDNKTDIDKLHYTKFWGNTDDNDLDLSVGNDAYVKNVENSSFQFTPNSTNYPRTEFVGSTNTQQTALLIYTAANIISLGNVSECPSIPDGVCGTLHDALPTDGIVESNPIEALSKYIAICEGEPHSVKFFSSTGTAPITYTYDLVTKLEGVVQSTLTDQTVTTDAGSTSPMTVSVTIPTGGEHGTSYEYILRKVVDSRTYYDTSGQLQTGITTEYSRCENKHKATVFIKDCSKDSDGDSIKDNVDNDDDNDGILDTEECEEETSEDISTAYDNGQVPKITPADLGLSAGNTGTVVDKDISDKYGYPVGSGAVVLTLVDYLVDSSGKWGVDATHRTVWTVKGTMSRYVVMDYKGDIPSHSVVSWKILDGEDLYEKTNYDPNALLFSKDQYTKMLSNITDNSQYAELRYVNKRVDRKYFSFGLEFSESMLTGAALNYNVGVKIECDTDNDAIPNRLDLDSDGDDCPDALEGGTNDSSDPIMETTLVDAGGDLVSQTVTQNFGTTSDANGKPLVGGVAYTQTVGVSQEFLTISITENPTDNVVCVGEVVMFTSTVTVSPTTTEVNYHWEYSSDSGNTWTEIISTSFGSNATVEGAVGTVASGASVTLTLSDVQIPLNQMELRVHYWHENNVCETFSSPAILTVYELPDCAITDTNANMLHCPNSILSFRGIDGVTAYAWSVEGGGATVSGVANEQNVHVLSGANDTTFTLTLTVTNEHGCIRTCSQLIDVFDHTPPTVTTTANFSLCVQDIEDSSYDNTTKGDVNTPTDYYTLPVGYTGFDIEIADECCISEDGISWVITPLSNGESISGTGQPSTSIVGKKLWLDVANENPKSAYAPKVYTITYTVEDCDENTTVKTVQITIRPRPKINGITSN